MTDPIPEPAPRPRSDKASPWPFVGMAGMAAAFFLYAASGLVAPFWAVVGLLGLWLVMFVLACRWWTPHPKRTLLVPLIALVVWFAVLTLGEVLLDWTA